MNPLKLWEHRAFFSQQTINRIEDAELIFKRFAFLSLPPNDDEKEDRRLDHVRKNLRNLCRTNFFTACASNLSMKAKNSETAREMFQQALTEVPTGTRNGKGQWVDFYTLRPPWIDYKGKFEIFGGPERIGGSVKRSTRPEYAVLGWYIATLDALKLNEVAKFSCSQVPELKEETEKWDTHTPLPSLV